MNEIADIIQAAFEAGGASMRAMLRPQDDRMTQREAFDVFGRACVERLTAAGVVSYYRAGNSTNSSKYYSRAQLQQAVAAERIKGDIVKHLNKL